MSDPDMSSDALSPSRLELRGMGYRRDGKQILSDLSLDLPVARLGVVGRNGSGKSTLARLLAGLVTPTEGEIRINGADLAQDRRAALREVGILFQNPDHQLIFPTVVEEIAFGLRQLGHKPAEADNRARATLDGFGKAHWHDAYVNTLSQGQKHLLCLMAVAAMAPRLLILDEPFAGLDIPTRAQLRRYLSYYRGNLIHITHDPADLDGYEQTLWLDQGRVRAFGAANEVVPDYVAAMTELGDLDDIADITDPHRRA